MLPISDPPSHHLSTKLVGQLLLDFLDLPCLAIVSQSPCHLLVGHFLTIAFLDAPAMRQCFFVFGGELESTFFLVYPPDAVLHVSAAKEVQKELIQTYLFLAACVRVREERQQSITVSCWLGKQWNIYNSCNFQLIRQSCNLCSAAFVTTDTVRT